MFGIPEIIIIGLGLIFSVVLFLMPFFVYSINTKIKHLNKQIEDLNKSTYEIGKLLELHIKK